MPAINSTQQLAKIRSQIDGQQQIIGQLEMELQLAILGAPSSTLSRNLQDIVDDVGSVYQSLPNGSVLQAGFEEGLEAYLEDANGGVADFANQLPEQDVIRHMLYQARALLGELRIEEQQWNAEVGEEKARKKEQTDLAKA